MPSMTIEQVEALNELSETLEAQIKSIASMGSVPFALEFNKTFARKLYEISGVSYENAVLIGSSIDCDIHEEVDTQEAKDLVERISGIMVDALLTAYDSVFDRKSILANYNVDILKNIAGQMYLKL